MLKSIFSLIFLTISFGLFSAASIFGQGQSWAQTDFIIADPFGDRIAVFDNTLTFKGYLDAGAANIDEPWGLTILSNGKLAAVARNGGVNGRIKIYNPDGTIFADFTDPNVGNPVDIKASGGIYYVPQSAASPGGIAKYVANTYNSTFGNNNFGSVAVLPANVLWAGGSQNTVSIFDLTTDSLTGSFTLDNGQVRAETMFYSPTTSTVLMLGAPGFDTVYERNLSGGFIRQFVAPMGGFVNYGVTRGPSDDVFATRLFGPPITVIRWDAAGNFISTTDISAFITGAANIVWVGNFAPSAAGVRISGRVMREDGNGIPNAIVTLTGSSNGPRTARANPFGYFSFEDVRAGGSYVVSISHKSYQFAPRIISVNDELADVDFTPISSKPTGMKKGRF